MHAASYNDKYVWASESFEIDPPDLKHGWSCACTTLWRKPASFHVYRVSQGYREYSEPGSRAGKKYIYIRSSSSNSSPRLLAKYTLLLSYTPKYSPAPTSVQTPRKAPPLNSPFTPDSAMISLAI